MMDNILGHLPFVVVYINDILVFSDNEQDHHGHLQTVLSLLQENELVARQDKCVFGASSVEFLGHVISVDGTNPEQGQCHHRLPHSYNHHGPEGVLDSTSSLIHIFWNIILFKGTSCVFLFKARCTPEKLTILTKHSKTLFFNHVVKNIVNYQLQKLYIKRTSIKGLNYAFATWCHSALKYL